MRAILFNLDGHSTSGVVTFCKLLGEKYSDLLVVSLNMNSNEPWFENELIFGPNISYKGKDIAEIIFTHLVHNRALEDEWLLIPNVGDICHFAAIELARMIKIKSGINSKIIGICHSDDEGQFQVLECYREALSGVSAVSFSVMRKLEDRIPALYGNVCRIDYPIDLSNWNAPINLKKADVRLEIVYVGRLDRLQKRIERLPLLVTELASREIDFRLTIVGDGRDSIFLRDEIEAISDDRNAHQVEFTGKLDHSELAYQFRDKHVFVLVSEYEGTPIALLESMAAGLCPVVMNVDSGIPEVIESNLNGIVVDQGDIRQMADELEMLSNDSQKLNSLRISARNTVFSRNSIAECWKKIVKFSQSYSPTLKLDPQDFPRSLYSAEIDAFAERMRLGDWKKIGIYGGGLVGRQILDSFRVCGVGVEVVFDTDPRKWGQYESGVSCVSPDRMREYQMDVIVIGSFSFIQPIEEKIENVYKGVEDSKPLVLALSNSS